MEPLITLGLACNVMQVISFGHEAVSMCQRVHQSGSPLYDNNFEKVTKQLAELSANLAGDLTKQSQPLNRGDKALVDIANDCTKAVTDILDELGFLKGKQNDLRDALKIAIKTAWRKKRLTRLEKNLAEWQKTMETGILVRLSQKVQSLEVEQTEDFQSLNVSDLQSLSLFIPITLLCRSACRNSVANLRRIGPTSVLHPAIGCRKHSSIATIHSAIR